MFDDNKTKEPGMCEVGMNMRDDANSMCDACDDGTKTYATDNSDEVKHHITVAHICPEYLNLYGDSGNILVLRKRCEWRGIDFSVREIRLGDDVDLDGVDIAVIGGGSDRDQKVVADYLHESADAFDAYVQSDGCLLAVCGGYQLLGESYETADGDVVKGMGIVDMRTVNGSGRLIGNVAINASMHGEAYANHPIVGFENHGGRTLLGGSVNPLGKVIYGHGNDGRSGYEGVMYRNVIGTYIHGPLLPKNPFVADDLICRALRRQDASDDLYSLCELPDDETFDLTANRSCFERFKHHK